MLSKRARQIMLHTGIALTMTMASTTFPHPAMRIASVEASTISTVSGTLTVSVPSLWAYSAPDWSARSRTYSQGTVLQVVERHSVEGRGMYRLSNGLYITANTAYVTFTPSAAQVLDQTATQGDYRITTANLNLRSGAGTGFSVLLTIPRGTRVRVEAVSGGWGKVTYGGRTGYVSTSFLEKEAVASPAPADLRTTTVNLNLRSGAGTGFSILATIPQGTQLTVESESGGWARVVYGNLKGFVSAQFLQSSGTSAPVPEPAPPAAPADLRETTVNLNLRSGAGTGFSILATIPQGTRLTVESESGGWARVRHGGQTGFVSTQFLQKVGTETPPPAPEPAPPAAPADLRETTVNLNLRSGAGTSFSILATIPQGTRLTVESENGGWAKVTHGGQTGHVASAYLRAVGEVTPAPEPEPTPEPPAPPEAMHHVTMSNLNLRSGAGTNFSILTTIPRGTTVTVEALESDWGKVTYAGLTGYVTMQYLQAADAPAPPPEPEPEPAPAPPPADLRETTANLNLRSGAGTGFSILTTIPRGAVLTIEEEQSGWARTKYQGLEGYVAAQYLNKVTSTTPPGEEAQRTTVLEVESPSGSAGYEDVRVSGYLISDLELREIQIRVNGNLIGVAATNLPRPDLAESFPEYANAGESGYTLLLGKDRFLKGANQIAVDAVFVNGTRVSKTVNLKVERPDTLQEGGLDDMDVLRYDNVDIAVTGFARMEAGVQSVRVFLNGNPQGFAQTGLQRADRNGEMSGFRYVVKRNNLFPGSNVLHVEITGKDGAKISFSKTIQVEKVPVIVIDAGHGGKDSGARGILNGAYVYEKNLVLQHAHLLNEELKKRGFKTVMTRTDDRFIELNDRAKMANDHFADLFLSIHHDFSPNESSQGAFLIYPSYKSTSISESIIKESVDAAGYLKKALVDSGFAPRRDGTDVNIAGHTLAVLRQTETRSLLAEIGYLSNPGDLQRITDPVYQRAVAHALAKQIEAYFQRK